MPLQGLVFVFIKCMTPKNKIFKCLCNEMCKEINKMLWYFIGKF